MARSLLVLERIETGASCTGTFLGVPRMSLHLQTTTDEHWLFSECLWEWGQLKLELQVTGGELRILFSCTELLKY